MFDQKLLATHGKTDVMTELSMTTKVLKDSFVGANCRTARMPNGDELIDDDYFV